MLEKQDDNLIDSLIERVSGSSENVSGWSNLGVQDPAIDWQNERVIRQAKWMKWEWLNERSRWPFFDPSPWANGLTENKQTKTDPGVPQSTVIILQQSTTYWKETKSTWYKCFPSSFLVWESCIWMWLCEMNSWVRSWLTVMNLQDTCTTVRRERFSMFFFIFFLFFSSILFLFLLESSGVSGSRMSLTSKKSGAPHLRKSHSCTEGKPTKSTYTTIAKKREPLPIPRRWKPPAKWSGFSSFQSGKLLLSKLCPMHVALWQDLWKKLHTYQYNSWKWRGD